MERIDPKQPTTAPGGSLEKFNLLAARQAAGVPLFHPDDNPMPIAAEPPANWESTSRDARSPEYGKRPRYY